MRRCEVCFAPLPEWAEAYLWPCAHGGLTVCADCFDALVSGLSRRELAQRLGVAEQVVFAGSLPHDAVFSWLDGLDLYIQPSLQEGLPRALIEAMSRGLPAFAAYTGGMPELLGDACIFAKKDVRGIVRLLDACTPERMAAMAECNFAAAQAFEKETLARKRTQFYAAFAAAAEGAGV